MNTMKQSMTIDIIHDGALRLLRDMEYLQLIRVRKDDSEKKKTQRLSERFAGALHLTDEQYDEFQTMLKQSRNEWERDIY
jgi:hypothetical protein